MMDPSNIVIKDDKDKSNEELPIGVRIAMRFTMAEQNIICIYKQNSRYETIKAITWATPYVSDDDIKAVMSDAINKLECLTDMEFEVAEFTENYPETDE